MNYEKKKQRNNVFERTKKSQYFRKKNGPQSNNPTVNKLTQTIGIQIIELSISGIQINESTPEIE